VWWVGGMGVWGGGLGGLEEGRKAIYSTTLPPVFFIFI